MTNDEVRRFEEDGYVIVRSLFDAEEISLLRRAARDDERLAAISRDIDDGDGGRARLGLWNEEGDDIFSLVARSPRVVDAVEALLGGEVYHYHSKMSMKEPFEGGAWVWHQDYGYWYGNGFLFPDLASCFLAVDRNTRENGCMQVLRGSHRMGRIDHGGTGGQTGADVERVEEASKVLELVHVELDPGDALFFHCNTLHRSDANRSPDPRWSLICCYCTVANSPYRKGPHPQYHPLQKVADDAVLEEGRRRYPSAAAR